MSGYGPPHFGNVTRKSTVLSRFASFRLTLGTDDVAKAPSFGA